MSRASNISPQGLRSNNKTFIVDGIFGNDAYPHVFGYQTIQAAYTAAKQRFGYTDSNNAIIFQVNHIGGGLYSQVLIIDDVRMAKNIVIQGISKGIDAVSNPSLYLIQYNFPSSGDGSIQDSDHLYLALKDISVSLIWGLSLLANSPTLTVSGADSYINQLTWQNTQGYVNPPSLEVTGTLIIGDIIMEGWTGANGSNGTSGSSANGTDSSSIGMPGGNGATAGNGVDGGSGITGGRGGILYIRNGAIVTGFANAKGGAGGVGGQGGDGGSANGGNGYNGIDSTDSFGYDGDGNYVCVGCTGGTDGSSGGSGGVGGNAGNGGPGGPGGQGGWITIEHNAFVATASIIGGAGSSGGSPGQFGYANGANGGNGGNGGVCGCSSGNPGPAGAAGTNGSAGSGGTNGPDGESGSNLAQYRSYVSWI